MSPHYFYTFCHILLHFATTLPSSKSRERESSAKSKIELDGLNWIHFHWEVGKSDFLSSFLFQDLRVRGAVFFKRKKNEQVDTNIQYKQHNVSFLFCLHFPFESLEETAFPFIPFF